MATFKDKYYEAWLKTKAFSFVAEYQIKKKLCDDFSAEN